MAACFDNCPALVLNADFRPLSYFPLSLWSWQDTVKAVFLDRVNIISHYDVRVRSPSFEMRLPSVISLKEYVPRRAIRPSPGSTCFCATASSASIAASPIPSHDLTFDHLVPRSRGGRTTWDNVVTACGSCNLLKGNRLPRESGMYPRHRPVQPTTHMLQRERPRLSAQLPAPELARLPLLGHRARPVLTLSAGAGDDTVARAGWLGERQFIRVLGRATKRSAG